MHLRLGTGKVRNNLPLLLVVLLTATSLLAIQPTTAQSIPEPSVPEFTIKLIDSSYDVEAIYSTDPYAGEKVFVEPAHQVNNGTIELSIKNQQYSYSNGTTFRIYYNVRTGGHFGDLVELYPPFKAPLGLNMDSVWFITTAPAQSETSYTIISLSSTQPPQTMASKML